MHGIDDEDLDFNVTYEYVWNEF